MPQPTILSGTPSISAVSATNTCEPTLLMRYVEKGDVDAVRTLLDLGADLNRTDDTGNSAMTLAINTNNNEILTLFFDNGANVDGHTDSGIPYIVGVATIGDLATLKLFISKGVDVNISDSNGWTPLMAAAKRGREDICDALLDSGAKFNVLTKDGWSATISAISSGNIQLAKRFLKLSSYSGQPFSGSWTPLMVGVCVSVPIFYLTEYYDREIDAKFVDGRTPLIFAIECNATEAVDSLLFNGANPNTTLPDGSSCLMIASSRNSDPHIIRSLLKYDAQVNHRDVGGWDSLILAAQEENMDIVKKLLEKGADPKNATNDGWTALMAASGKSIEIVRMLVQAGAEVNAEYADGRTALILAACDGKNEIVNFLVEAGANIDKKDQSGMSALDWAITLGHDSVVKTLSGPKPSGD
ncbi:MAG: ankyrin repeat domain-containing protein [Candidatus Omnitrophica bacterium]|nr:ankyrin repeat domain-containing protein [Candidatus Omnitrophota bacterium]